MPVSPKNITSKSQCWKSLFLFIFLTSIYALAFIILPYSIDNDTGHITALTAFADDDGGDGGGHDGGSDDGGDSSGSDSGDDGGGDDGDGGDDGGDGDDGGNDDGDYGDDGNAVNDDHGEDAYDDRHGDVNDHDSDRDAHANDGKSGTENRQTDRDRFDFGDLDNLDPMSTEEEAGVVGNWN